MAASTWTPSHDVYERFGTATTRSSSARRRKPASSPLVLSRRFRRRPDRVSSRRDETLTGADTDGERATSTSAPAPPRRCLSIGPHGGNGSFDARFVLSLLDGTPRFFGDAGVTGRRRHRRRVLDVYERASGHHDQALDWALRRATARPTRSSRAPLLDGSRVVFETVEPLVVTDTDTVNDIYERYAGTTTHISIGPSGGNAAIAAFFDGITDAGLRIFFDTRESLMTSDTDTARDLYVADVAGYAAAHQRADHQRAARARPEAMHGAEPHARAPARVRVLQPGSAGVGQPDRRRARVNSDSRRTRPASRSTSRSSVRLVRPDDSDVLVPVQAHGCPAAGHAGRLHRTASGDDHGCG